MRIADGLGGAARAPIKVAYEGFEAMSRVPSLSSPFLLGFDEIERALDRVTKAADGYPPYNIERIARENGQPIDLVFLLLAPEGAGADHLKALARVARLLRDGEVARKLRNSNDAEALYAVLAMPSASAA